MSRLFLEIFKPVDSQVMERKNEHTAKDWAFTLEAVWAVGLFDASPTLHPFQTLRASPVAFLKSYPKLIWDA
jgi:hypothetical protein